MAEGTQTGGGSAADGSKGAGEGGQNPPAFDPELTQGLDLKALGAAEVKRLKQIEANLGRKRKKEMEELKSYRQRAEDFDALAPILRDERVKAAIGQVTGRQDLAGLGGHAGEDAGEIEVPEFDDPKEAIRWAVKQGEARALAKFQREAEGRDRSLTHRFGAQFATLQKDAQARQFERLAAGYADDPEIMAAQEEVLDFAETHGVPVDRAFYAVTGPILEERARENKTAAHSEKLERARSAASDPMARLTKALATRDPNKKFRTLREARAFREAQEAAAGA